MKVRKMMLMATLSVALTGAVSCSDSDDPKLTRFDCHCNDNNVKDFDGLKVDFCLLNERGEQKSEFKRGENIVFFLALYSESDKAIVLPAPGILFKSLFCVYSADGRKIGYPYDYLWDETDIGATIFLKNEPHTWMCPWRKSQKVTTSGAHFKFKQKTNNVLLKKGDYYAEVTMNLTQLQTGDNSDNIQQIVLPFKVK